MKDTNKFHTRKRVSLSLERNRLWARLNELESSTRGIDKILVRTTIIGIKTFLEKNRALTNDALASELDDIAIAQEREILARITHVREKIQESIYVAEEAGIFDALPEVRTEHESKLQKIKEMEEAQATALNKILDFTVQLWQENSTNSQNKNLYEEIVILKEFTSRLQAMLKLNNITQEPEPESEPEQEAELEISEPEQEPIQKEIFELLQIASESLISLKKITDSDLMEIISSLHQKGLLGDKIKDTIFFLNSLPQNLELSVDNLETILEDLASLEVSQFDFIEFASTQAVAMFSTVKNLNNMISIALQQRDNGRINLRIKGETFTFSSKVSRTVLEEFAKSIK